MRGDRYAGPAGLVSVGSHPGPRSRSLLAWAAGYCPSRGHTGAQYGNPFTLGAAPRFRMQDGMVAFKEETNNAAAVPCDND
jgi:hypothetical protein